MIHRVGNMFQVWETTDLFVISTNSYINRVGDLVMGRGIAYDVATRWPQLPSYYGQLLLTRRLHLRSYGFLPPDPSLYFKSSGMDFNRHPQSKIALFQVKTHFNFTAQLDLIQQSVEGLRQWLQYRPPYRVDMNFPGIGNGSLTKSEILPLLVGLPDNVTVWELA